MADPLDPALPSNATAEFARIEAEWREALSNGQADGDTRALVYELMPAIHSTGPKPGRVSCQSTETERGLPL